MKRIVSLLLVLISVATVFAACKKESPYDPLPDSMKNAETTAPGANNNTKDPVSSPATDFEIPVNEELTYDYDFSEYLVLPDYKSFELSYSIEPSDEEAIDDQIYNLMVQVAKKTPVTGRAARHDDVVTVDYEAKYYGKDDVALSENGATFTIGRYNSVPGFVEAMEGMVIGETKTVDLVFPSDSTLNPNLAGSKLTFEIKLKAINTVELPELNADTIASFDLQGVYTEEQLRTYIKNAIDNKTQMYKKQALWNMLGKTVNVIKFPEKEIAYYEGTFDLDTENLANFNATTVESYILTNYGSRANYEAARDSYAKMNVLEDMMAHALNEGYDIQITKEEFNTALVVSYEEGAESVGITTYEDYYDKFGYTIYSGLFRDLVLEAAAKDVPDKN